MNLELAFFILKGNIMLTLSLNQEAADLLGSNNITRLRLLTKVRGGVSHIGLRPSHRVSGKNVMLRLTGNEIKITNDDINGVIGLPELKVNNQYSVSDIGYCWFILTPIQEMTSGPIVTVTE